MTNGDGQETTTGGNDVGMATLGAFCVRVEMAVRLWATRAKTKGICCTPALLTMSGIIERVLGLSEMAVMAMGPETKQWYGSVSVITHPMVIPTSLPPVVVSSPSPLIIAPNSRMQHWVNVDSLSNNRGVF